MFCTLLVLLSLSSAQQIGYQQTETHPSLSYSTCTKSGGCQQQQGNVVLDANWRWVHTTGTYTNCYTGDKWDTSICPDGITCAKNCAVDGAVYDNPYGIHTNGNELQLDYVTQGQYGKNVGSRTFLMDGDNSYKMFKLKNKEFTFDVDDSQMPCGLNGALYFVEMQADGGKSEYPNNNAGARYGTGYCDAQCPHDIKWINGEANSEGWNPSPTDPNSGVGKYGTCCSEMDIWEANKISNAYTPHPCTTKGQYRCEGTECGDNASGERYDGVCDKDGCDLNPYRVGNKTFYGPGSQFALDSTRKMTVVTQFITSDGTDTGDLTEIRRLYVQDGKVIQTPKMNLGGVTFDSVTDDFCNKNKDVFGDKNDFSRKGGMKAMGQSLERGMVLVMSLWDDHDAHMLWLDSNFPTDKPATTPGVARGSCPITSGVPADVEAQYPDSHVKFSNIKFGEIDSTYDGGGGGGCPGGSLSACIALCPSSPPEAYKACVEECVTRCS